MGSKYREELKKNLCILGKSRGNNGGKRELVQKMHGLGYLGFDLVIGLSCIVIFK